MAWQRDNRIETIDAPLGERFVSQADEQTEGSRPEASPDNEAPDPIGNVNQPIRDFDFRRTLQKNRSVQALTWHSAPPTSNATRQRASGHTSLSLINSRCSNLIDTVNQPSAESHPAEGHNESRATTPARGRSGHLFFCSRSGISQAAES